MILLCGLITSLLVAHHELGLRGLALFLFAVPVGLAPAVIVSLLWGAKIRAECGPRFNVGRTAGLALRVSVMAAVRHAAKAMIRELAG